MLAKDQILQGRYRIIRQLGEGGMGTVYEAEDSQLFGKPVALKEILHNLTQKNSGHFRRAFEREAKILTQIDHEAVPKVIGYFQEDNRQFLVMELVEGDDFDIILEKRHRPFPLKDVLGWANQLLNALDYLHTLKKPIIHRDIKPQNLKLTAKGKIKLLDFGIAKDSNTDISLTKATRKTFIGATLYYSPIEQIIRIPDYFEMLNSVYPEKTEKIIGESADARSDIYSLGATLYHFLTNTFPKPAHIRAFEIWSEKEESMPLVHTVNPKIPLEISNILAKAMEVSREDRFESVHEMQLALRAVSGQEKKRKKTLSVNPKVTDEIEDDFVQIALEAELREAEAERKRKEYLEYKAKLEKWRKQHYKKTSDKSAEADHDSVTLPFDIQSEQENEVSEEITASKKKEVETKEEITKSEEIIEPEEETLVPIVSEEKETFVDTSVPVVYLEGVDIEAEEGKNTPDTVENVQMATSPNVLPAKRKQFWVYSAAIIVLMFLGVSAFGLFYVFSGSNNAASNKTTSDTKTVLPANLPENTPTPELSIAPSIVSTPIPTISPPEAETSPAPTAVSEIEKPKPIVVPTPNKTPAQVPVKTPEPRIKNTPKPKPPKNSDCIFTGDC